MLIKEPTCAVVCESLLQASNSFRKVLLHNSGSASMMFTGDPKVGKDFGFPRNIVFNIV